MVLSPYMCQIPNNYMWFWWAYGFEHLFGPGTARYLLCQLIHSQLCSHYCSNGEHKNIPIIENGLSRRLQMIDWLQNFTWREIKVWAIDDLSYQCCKHAVCIFSHPYIWLKNLERVPSVSGADSCMWKNRLFIRKNTLYWSGFFPGLTSGPQGYQQMCPF